MHIHSELLYTDNERIIVKVSGWEANKDLGSALGQGLTVESAEDNAIQRLTSRIKGQNIKQENGLSDKVRESEIINNNLDKSYIDQNKVLENQNKTVNEIQLPSSIPDDWSNELLEYENEIKRISLEKEAENELISLTIGINNRNMITEYDDIVFLIKILRNLEPGESVESLKLVFQRDNLINQNNNILRDLNWDTNMARTFLYKNFNLTSRSELNNKKLIVFNMMLEDIRGN